MAQFECVAFRRSIWNCLKFEINLVGRENGRKSIPYCRVGISRNAVRKSVSNADCATWNLSVDIRLHVSSIVGPLLSEDDPDVFGVAVN